MRKRQTDAERLIWSKLRDRQLAGYKFRRQELLGHYIADFVCFEAKLVVELDGGQHGEQLEYDAERSNYLNRVGFRVARFWNNEVLKESEAVLECIRLELIKFPLPQGFIPFRVEGHGEGIDNNDEHTSL